MIKRYLLAASLCLTVPFLAPSGISASTVNAENTVNDMIVGPVEQEDADITIDESTETENAVEEETTKEDNRYADLAFSIANNYVNIRKKPNLESKVVGKLYKGSAATVISEKNDWVKVESGTVTGYISKEFLAIGEDAEKLLDEYATKTATVTTETLKVREKPNTDSDCLTLVGEGDTYTVTKESKNWVKIKINSSETSTRKGYLSKDFADVSYEYEYAVSIEEELARIAAEEAAKKRKKLVRQKKLQDRLSLLLLQAVTLEVPAVIPLLQTVPAHLKEVLLPPVVPVPLQEVLPAAQPYLLQQEPHPDQELQATQLSLLETLMYGVVQV